MNYKEFEQTAIPQRTYLYNYAIYITKNSEDARDLMQETYLKAYRFWSYFEKGSNIKAWLFRIMKNSYINLYRKEYNGPKKVAYEENHIPYHTTQEILFDHKCLMRKSYHEIFGDEITCSIDSLSDDFKDVILLSDVEGLTYEEIAKIIDCPIGTVRSRLFRGRKLLRKKLFTYAKDNGYILKGSQFQGFRENTHSTKNHKYSVQKN
jgi:RNA polymerase sigma-70 factor (ECF subfamily)